MNDRAVPRIPTDGDPSDDDVVTWWGLVVEGFTATAGRLGTDVEAGGLAPSAFEVLLRLLRAPGHRLATTQLAREVSFSSGGFTKLADRLDAAGLVRRVPCPGDRRVTWIELTPSGLATVRRAHDEHAASLRRHVVDTIGPDAFAALAATMRALRDAARNDTTRGTRTASNGI